MIFRKAIAVIHFIVSPALCSKPHPMKNRVSGFPRRSGLAYAG